MHGDEGIELNLMKSFCDWVEKQSGSDREGGFRQEEEARKCFYLKK